MKRFVAMLSVVALIGCGTAQKKPPPVDEPPSKEQGPTEAGSGARTAKGAVGGAAMGAITCLSFAPTGLGAGGVGVIVTTAIAIVCVPFGAVAGAVVGGSVAAAKSPASSTPTAARPSTPAEVASRYSTQGRFVLMASGHVELGDSLPPGSLLVAMNTIAAEGSKKRASLVLELDSATEAGGRSVVAQTTIDCETGGAAIQRSFTYAEAFGNGALVLAQEHVPPIAVEKPGAALSSALRSVCEAGPWWNTPAQLYGQ